MEEEPPEGVVLSLPLGRLRIWWWVRRRCVLGGTGVASADDAVVEADEGFVEGRLDDLSYSASCFGRTWFDVVMDELEAGGPFIGGGWLVLIVDVEMAELGIDGAMAVVVAGCKV